MSEQEDKLKLIEEELKTKALQIEVREKKLEKREKDIIGKANVLSKDKLFQFLVKSLSDIYVTYETSTGTTAGCREVINNILDARNHIDVIGFK
tara:strand:+ start:773 stop:1054 length:282 start_codon:yes stop_codon:yes gene_type:complete